MSFLPPINLQNHPSISSPSDPWISAHQLSEEDTTFELNAMNDDKTLLQKIRSAPQTASREDESGLDEVPKSLSLSDDPASICEDGLSLIHFGPNSTRTSTQYSQGNGQEGAFNGQFAVGRRGWWKRQMLVDRSLRSMAALMSVFAVIMVLICVAYFRDFLHRGNPQSTSVGSNVGENCEAMESRNTVLHLLINIAATMILGMSNTYQQLVTSLNVGEIQWALSKRGDSRVGTNSPMAINDKKSGKAKSWLAWLFLISTSMPIHFLANSVIGPSWYIAPPHDVKYAPTSLIVLRSTYGTYQYSASDDFGCWTAFRTGKCYSIPDTSYLDFESRDLLSFSSVTIYYNTADCTQYLNATLDTTTVENEWKASPDSSSIGNCSMTDDIFCNYGGSLTSDCRLSIRMQAALTLAGCLISKAFYMIVINLRARRRVKSNCLTFGDVITASSLDPGLRIRNECMVNAGDGYRCLVSHICHKHCKDTMPSKTGDPIGHCQDTSRACKKFNTVDKAADLVHPVIAIKFKKSLISNLGVTAVSQMILLMFASLSMAGLSIMLAVEMGLSATAWTYCCPDPQSGHYKGPRSCDSPVDCTMTKRAYLNTLYGGWGGFNSSVTLASLAPNSLTSEQQSFMISNGAQLLYSLLYLLLVYNITLISMEHDWGKFERQRQKLRCTLVSGEAFNQSYFLQLPRNVILPLMVFSSAMHWLLGQAISTRESVWSEPAMNIYQSEYSVVFAVYPIWLSTILMMGMTATCWWAFTYKREGFMPQMYGSIRACCAATTELDSFTTEGIKWGDLGAGDKFRHSGFSAGSIGEIEPAELYSGGGHLKEKRC